jgi:hypothetical protein
VYAEKGGAFLNLFKKSKDKKLQLLISVETYLSPPVSKYK